MLVFDQFCRISFNFMCLFVHLNPGPVSRQLSLIDLDFDLEFDTQAADPRQVVFYGGGGDADDVASVEDGSQSSVSPPFTSEQDKTKVHSVAESVVVRKTTTTAT